MEEEGRVWFFQGSFFVRAATLCSVGLARLLVEGIRARARRQERFRGGDHTMAVENAWNPLAVALVATAAVAFQVFSGFVNCDFIRVTARDGEILAITETSAQELASETKIGLLCDGEFYDLDDDDMRMYSQYFFYGATGLGGLCMLGAWAITLFLKPTMCAWRIIPFMSSACALVNLPTFLILESYPCDDFEEQTCQLSWDSYYLMAAVALYVLVTAMTQFLDPPEWFGQLHHWRVPKMRTTETNFSSEEEDDGSGDPILTPRLAPPKPSWLGRLLTDNKHKAQKEQDAYDRQIHPYAPPPTDLEQGDSLVEEEVVSTQASDDPSPPQAAEWTEFESKTSPFRETDPTDAVSEDVEDVAPQLPEPTEPPEPRALYRAPDIMRELPEPRALYNETPSLDAPLSPLSSPSLPPRTPQRREYAPPPKLNPATPLAASMMQRGMAPNIMPPSMEQTPISPLTHQTTEESAPDSPSIERTSVQDPILRPSSRVSTPSRRSAAGLDETELTTPVKRLTWEQHESVLDGVKNGDDSLLDSSFESQIKRDVPFIPTIEDSKRIASLGGPIYADLLKEDQSKSSAKSIPDRLDELVDRGISDASMEDSLLASQDVHAIAIEGTPVYASLLMEQIQKSTNEMTVLTLPNKSISREAYMKQTSSSRGSKEGERSFSKDNPGAIKIEGKAPWNLGASLRRSHSGYDKLVNAADSDEDQADVPPMTEVSFDPSEIQEVTLDKDAIHRAETNSEQVLLDEWNKMFDAKGPIPVKLKESQSQDEDDDEDDKDEAELLRIISSEDFSDESPVSKTERREDEEDDTKGDSASSPSPDKPPRSGGGTTLRPKRRTRRSRNHASGSVGSSPSLLSHTIEEETQSDLEESNKEEKTPLSRYAPESNKQRNVAESLSMSGVHAYLAVEQFRSHEREQKEVTAGVQEALRRSRTSNERSQGERAKAIRSLSPTPGRVSTWRSERENRGGIHDVAVVSDDDDDKKEDTGKSANDLRQARIQRLQQRPKPELGSLARARLRRQQVFGDKIPPAYFPNSSAEDKPEEGVQPHKSKSPPRPSSRPTSVPPAEDGSATTTPDDMSNEVGSFLIHALDLDMNDLDASLAALSRPDGSEYGPDEHSI